MLPDDTVESVGAPADLRLLFHRLNNQLGVVLAHAELLQAKAPDETNRSRASHVVNSVLHALGTTRELSARIQTDDVFPRQA